jgi:hypothetical protein
MRNLLTVFLATLMIAEVSLAQSKTDKRRSKKSKAPATNSEVAPSDPTGSTNIGEEPPPSSTNDSEMATDETSKGRRDPKKVSDSKVSTQGTIRGPGWMFDLGLTATPGEFYESSLVSAITTLGQATVSLKSTSDDSEISYNAKPQFASLASTYQAKTSSKKFAYGVSADVTRSIGKGDITSGGVKASISTKDDNPSTSAFVSAQVRPGLWFGFGSKWGNSFNKTETKTSFNGTTVSDTTETERKETTSQVFAFEVISNTSRAGLEYEIESDKNELSRSIDLPLRLGVTETLFTGFTLNQTDEDDFESAEKKSSFGVSWDVGQQFSSFGYLLSYDYDVKKSVSASTQSLNKTKAGSIAIIMGPPKGMRFGVGLAYFDSIITESPKSVLKTRYPMLALFLTRAN